MSILIKGLDMPKEGSIIMVLEPSGRVNPKLVNSKELSVKELDFTQAIQIPTPHGRLIDGDKLKPILKEYCLDDDEELEKWYSLMGIDDCIDDFAPTILEAER